MTPIRRLLVLPSGAAVIGLGAGLFVAGGGRLFGLGFSLRQERIIVLGFTLWMFALGLAHALSTYGAAREAHRLGEASRRASQ